MDTGRRPDSRGPDGTHSPTRTPGAADAAGVIQSVSGAGPGSPAGAYPGASHPGAAGVPRESLGLRAHQLEMTVLMTPDMANFAGNVHGGAILKLLDQVAYACAARYAGAYVVTLSVDQVTFLQPIHVGELLTFLASVNHTGRSSMEVGIKVVTENIRDGMLRHTNSCFFTMVAVGDDRRPIPVPQRIPNGPVEERRYRAAQVRRQLRSEMTRRQRMADNADDGGSPS